MKQQLYYVTLDTVKSKTHSNLFAIIAVDSDEAITKALKYGEGAVITDGPYELTSAWDIAN